MHRTLVEVNRNTACSFRAVYLLFSDMFSLRSVLPGTQPSCFSVSFTGGRSFCIFNTTLNLTETVATKFAKGLSYSRALIVDCKYLNVSTVSKGHLWQQNFELRHSDTKFIFLHLDIVAMMYVGGGNMEVILLLTGLLCMCSWCCTSEDVSALGRWEQGRVSKNRVRGASPWVWLRTCTGLSSHQQLLTARIFSIFISLF